MLLAAMALAAGCCGKASPRRVAFGPADAADVTALAEAVKLVAALKYAPAADALVPLIPRFQQCDDRVRSAEATFWLGYCREKTQCPGEAMAHYQQVVSLWPETPAATQAAQRLAALRAG